LLGLRCLICIPLLTLRLPFRRWPLGPTHPALRLRPLGPTHPALRLRPLGPTHPALRLLPDLRPRLLRSWLQLLRHEAGGRIEWLRGHCRRLRLRWRYSLRLLCGPEPAPRRRIILLVQLRWRMLHHQAGSILRRNPTTLPRGGRPT
jgi:hypothetical protein